MSGHYYSPLWRAKLRKVLNFLTFACVFWFWLIRLRKNGKTDRAKYLTRTSRTLRGVSFCGECQQVTGKMTVVVNTLSPACRDIQFVQVYRSKPVSRYDMPREKSHAILTIRSLSAIGKWGWGYICCLHAPSLQICSQNAHRMCHLLMFGSKR